MVERNCLSCGVDISGLHWRCQRCEGCAREWRLADGRARGKWANASKGSPIYVKDCAVCGAAFTGRRPDVMFCSKRCQWARDRVRRTASGRKAEQSARRRARNADNPEYLERKREAQRRYQRRAFPAMSPRMREGRKRLRRAARGTTGGGVRWANGRCRRCGDQFTGKMNSDFYVPAYCSKRCATKDRIDSRRARVRGGGRVYRRVVFERDGWACQLCGDPVERDEVVPHPLAPTLDHVVPLALGGSHDMSNVQLAHFICNSRKGDGRWVAA